MEKIIKISCFEHVYPDKTKIELCGIEFIVCKGEKVAILGPSGGGKTTLIKHILGLLTPSRGEIRVFGVDPYKEYDKIKQKIGVVLQNVDEQLIGPTVLEDVMFSPLNYGYSQEESKEMALKIIEQFGISDLKDKIIHYLSGGEKRKVALAGALVLNPELLVLDEPFSGLDIRSEKEFIKLINKICEEMRISVVISTHNVELVSEFADTMYLISYKNRLSTKGSPREILYMDEELKNYNLEEPTIVKLFNSLKKTGFSFETNPINVEEAIAALKK
ncbi:MAG TPA: ABC transporter [Cyanobacteria bacterium UBA9971]|nr:ABC transporter [Cyanobacteria bacterium UBA9971]